MRPVIVLTFAVALAAQAPERLPQRLLFVGEAKHAARVKEFTDFLTTHFAKVTATTHGEYQPAMAEGADVVLLDWHQGQDVDRSKSPLGAFESWRVPLVLLGSAGLNTAVAWDVFGGAG